MKRSICLCALALCLLLCGCSAPPSAQPPADSRMCAGQVVFRNEEIISLAAYTMDPAQEDMWYFYCENKGVERTEHSEKITDNPYTRLTFCRYREMMERLVFLVDNANITAGAVTKGHTYALYYNPCYSGMNAKLADKEQPGAPSLDQGYFVYSLEQKQMSKKDGSQAGEDHWGYVEVQNQTDGSYAVILIAD